MKVKKRDGRFEEVSFDKIQNRLNSLCNLNEYPRLICDISIIAQKVCSEIYDGISTKELDILSCETCIALYSKDINYKELASRIIISNHHKNTSPIFSDVIEILYNNKIINKSLYNTVQSNKDVINAKIISKKDYLLDFFGFKTLEKSYLLRYNNVVIERPQYLFMRVALSIHRNNLDLAFQTYNFMSDQYFIHATPTLFNAGTNREQLSSCFLLKMEADSVTGIYNTITDCAHISKYAGGIGISIHNIRAKGSYINGTNGISNGIVPMLKVFNETARYIDQGGGKRNGSFAIYIEPWHADIMEFVELKKNHGNGHERARDLFYGLWICDLFMERVKTNSKWSLFCPNRCPGLENVYGEEFNELYLRYESEGNYVRQINAMDLWYAILTSQIETGTPYMLYKDSCNSKSNQQNLGVIQSSNLCTEIIEYSDKDETAVCNLASISLKKYIIRKDTSNINITIYSKPNCIYCTMAENLCIQLNINYDKIDYRCIEDQYKGVSNTYPKIFNTIDNSFIGGYIDLFNMTKPSYDYNRLKEITKVITVNLNNIIDNNFYPTVKTRRSNLRHRPIGIGVQGLANVFYEMGIPFDSEDAKLLNKQIFETIYYGALEASMEISKQREIMMKKLKDLKNMDPMDSSTKVHIIELESLLNPIEGELNRNNYLGTYSSYIGSPMYHGKLQPDLWNYELSDELHNWSELRCKIKKYGIRNSLLVSPMPTASTSQILSNYECIEPLISNIYVRRVLAGEYMVLNEYLIYHLKLCNLWNEVMKDKIIQNDGSIQNINNIPKYIKDIFKTAWEIKQKDIIDLAIDRSKYICQSQSLNLFMEAPTISKLSSMHFYAWSNGLKTGMYYLRSRPSSKALQFSIKPDNCETCSA